MCRNLQLSIVLVKNPEEKHGLPWFLAGDVLIFSKAAIRLSERSRVLPWSDHWRELWNGQHLFLKKFA
jgi:hypothetical protein